MVVELGIVIECREQDGPWGGVLWRPVAVVPGGWTSQQWQLLRAEGRSSRYYAGPLALELHAGDAEAYRENLADANPSVFVVLRHNANSDEPHDVRPVLVTAARYEAELHLEGGEDVMEPVPMPDLFVPLIEQFVRDHHVEQPFIKRQRQ
ncbi:DUF3305 domain-containing protein [Bradyrhizobium icense]|uniref:DUF3305 domain-containing protein n=1 Tax=Bradyrhizobium icense TaxID=1274631 RepID=UPI0009F47FF3|nr:DUF3305 domain-containing protein [Bradyrhizobium icense]